MFIQVDHEFVFGMKRSLCLIINMRKCDTLILCVDTPGAGISTV
jgi:hypothetical protein